MSAIESIHLAVIQPDDRGRFRLGKWASKDPKIQGWRVFVRNDGKTITLEAVGG